MVGVGGGKMVGEGSAAGELKLILSLHVWACRHWIAQYSVFIVLCNL